MRQVIPWFSIGVLAVAIAVLVATLVRDPSRARNARPRGERAGTSRVVAMAAIPIGAIVVFWLVAVFIVDLRPLAAHETFTVEATGSDSGWTYRYIGLDVGAAGILRLPVGSHVKLVLNSPDVVRSFWVPQIGIKQIVLPGHAYVVESTLLSPGYYHVLSSIDCGPEHYSGRSAIEVVPGYLFDSWKKEVKWTSSA